MAKLSIQQVKPDLDSSVYIYLLTARKNWLHSSILIR